MKLSIDGKLDFFPKSEIVALLGLDHQGKCSVESNHFWGVLSGKTTQQIVSATDAITSKNLLKNGIIGKAKSRIYQQIF